MPRPRRMPSFGKIDYLLRPSKQIERKLFIEALQVLSKAGYHIRDYQYIGFGSVYYADFILFHKYLSISEMTCIEKELVPRRMDFNKPYPFINVEIKSAREFIESSVPFEKPQFVWLDYDANLNTDMLEDIDGFLTRLPQGSVFVVSVSANAGPLAGYVSEPDRTILKGKALRERIAEAMNVEFGRFLRKPRKTIKEPDVKEENVPSLFSDLIAERIKQSLTVRSDSLHFHTLFKYVYADNAQMFTLGGIVDKQYRSERLRRSGVRALDFVVNRADDPPIAISVPRLTLREKQWLEQYRVDPASTEPLAFEMDVDAVKSFVRYYKYYPTYYETIT